MYPLFIPVLIILNLIKFFVWFFLKNHNRQQLNQNICEFLMLNRTYFIKDVYKYLCKMYGLPTIDKKPLYINK